METLIFKEYNIKIINLNLLLSEKIELQICNFIYDNNIKLDLNSSDIKKVYLHFLLKEIINYSDLGLYNFFIIKNNYKIKYLQEKVDYDKCFKLLFSLLSLINEKFNINIIFVDDNQKIDKSFIYKLKLISESKKIKSLRNTENFLQINKLNSILNSLKTNINNRLLLKRQN